MSQLHRSFLALILVIPFLSVSCSMSRSREGAVANSSTTNTTSGSQVYSVQLKGIIEDIDDDERELTIRLSADQTGGEEILAKVTLDAETMIEDEEQGAGQASNSARISKGLPVNITGRMIEGEGIEAKLVVLGTACKSDYCPVKDCRQKCGLKTCACPKTPPIKS